MATLLCTCFYGHHLYFHSIFTTYTLFRWILEKGKEKVDQGTIDGHNIGGWKGTVLSKVSSGKNIKIWIIQTNCFLKNRHHSSPSKQNKSQTAAHRRHLKQSSTHGKLHRSYASTKHSGQTICSLSRSRQPIGLYAFLFGSVISSFAIFGGILEN